MRIVVSVSCRFFGDKDLYTGYTRWNGHISGTDTSFCIMNGQPPDLPEALKATVSLVCVDSALHRQWWFITIIPMKDGTSCWTVCLQKVCTALYCKQISCHFANSEAVDWCRGWRPTCDMVSWRACDVIVMTWQFSECEHSYTVYRCIHDS